MKNPHLQDYLASKTSTTWIRTHTHTLLSKNFQTKDTFDGCFALLYCVYGYMMLLLTCSSAVHGVAVAGVALFL